jgi:predicted small secreted protein
LQNNNCNAFFIAVFQELILLTTFAPMMKAKKVVISLLAVVLTSLGACGNSVDSIGDPSLLREGDLMFVVTPGGDAITEVTQGVDQLKIDHVAIVHHSGDSIYALEAIGTGVCLTPIDTFMLRATPFDEKRLNSCSDIEKCSITTAKPMVIVGRLNDTTGVSQSVTRAMKYLGRPYDYYFKPDDKEIYCSELVQISYLDKDGKQIFKPIPMSFHDAKGKVTEFWKKYYAKHGLEVPEGAPGSNPGEMSRRDVLKIIYRFF